jgi:hypothetical protein
MALSTLVIISFEEETQKSTDLRNVVPDIMSKYPLEHL